MSPATALVTGTTGFLGSHIARALLEHGYQVRALHRSSSSFELIRDLDLERVQGDLFQPASLQQAAQGVDLIVHCAGLVARWQDPGRMVASHVEGTRNVLKAALRQHVRCLVHLSSAAALGVPRERFSRSTGMTENHLWNASRALWPYGYAKWRAELEVWQAAAAGLDARLALPSYVLGPGGAPRRAGTRLSGLAQRSLPIAPAGGVNVVHVQDVIDGVLAMIDRGRAGQRYLLVGHNLSVLEFLTELARAAGRRPPRWELPAGPLRAVGLISALLRRPIPWLPARLPMLTLTGQHFYYDNRRTRAQLQLPPPRPLQATIAAEAFASTPARS